MRKERPDCAGLECLTSEPGTWKLCEGFSAGKVSVEKLIKTSGIDDFWCESSGYRTVFGLLRKAGARVFPLDHGLEERKRLIGVIRSLHDDVLRGKAVEDKFNAYSALLRWERERVFVKNMMEAFARYGAKKTAVIVGPGHHGPMKSFFSDMYTDIKVRVVKPPAALAKKFREGWERKHLGTKGTALVPALCRLNVALRGEMSRVRG